MPRAPHKARRKRLQRVADIDHDPAVCARLDELPGVGERIKDLEAGDVLVEEEGEGPELVASGEG
mgnify:CR=1 FL=1